MAKPLGVSPATTHATQRPATVKIDERGGGAAVVAVRGCIDAVSAPLLRDALAWAVSCHERVVVDLSRAGHIDRTGLNILIAAQDRANNRAVQLCFTAPSPVLLSALCEMRVGEMLNAADAVTSRLEHRPADGADLTLPRPHGRLWSLPQTTS